MRRKINKVAEMRVREEINRGVQMIQYQVITLMTTNGQAPFITVFMYLDEVPEGQTRDDLAAIIEEMLHQRIKGVKNEKGVFITPAFPKLIYVLEEDNIHEDSKYFLSDTPGCTVYGKAHGSGLYFRKEDERTESGQERGRTLLSMYGMPQFSYSVY